MKKLFTIMAATALIAAMAATSLAYAPGDIVYEEDDDDDDYSDAGSTLTPGEDYYVILSYSKDDALKDATEHKEYPVYDSDSKKKPKSIKWRDLSVDDPNEDDVFEGSKAKRYVSLSSSPTRLKLGSGSGSYVWAAKLEPKSIKASDYDDESIDVDGYVEYTANDGKEYDFNLDFSIEYEEGDNEFEEDIRSFIFERNDDVDIDLPDGDGNLTGTANKDFTLLASMSTDINNTIYNKYPNANLDFYKGNGASLSYIKTARLNFVADKDHYLYEISSDNKLIDLSSTYSSSAGAFVVPARSLGSYVLSDRKLDASSSASGSTTTGSSKPTSSTGSSSSSSSSGGTSSLSRLSSLIEKNFSNKFLLLSYGTEFEVMNKALTFGVAVNTSGMNTADLCLYTYDAANNRLIGSANKPKVGADGKLTFVTNTKGYYVVSSGALAK